MKNVSQYFQVRNPSDGKIIYQFILIGVSVIVCRLCAAYCFSTFDDAFITYRYAENLASGNGLIYNKGEHVLGTTAPLFAVLCTIPALFSACIPHAILLFNIFCDLANFYLIAIFLFKKNKELTLIFGFLFAIDPTSNRISVGGMEANLFFLGSILVVIFYVRHLKIYAYSIASIIYFLRPEAVILILVLFLFDWFAFKTFSVQHILVCMGIIGFPLLLMYSFYGHLLPQSVIAKNQQGINSFENLIKSVLFPTVFSVLLFPLAIFGGIAASKLTLEYKIIRAWITIYAAAYIIKGPWVMNWYIYAIATGELILGTVALQTFSIVLSKHFSRSYFWTLTTIIPVICWITGALILGRSSVETKVFGALQKDFNAGSVRGRVIFADDIGALGFYTDAYIYDDLMLVTPQALDYKNPKERIENLKPDYLFLYSNTYYVNLVTIDSSIANHYSFIKRYSKNGETGMPELVDIDNTYKQDFILLKRNNY